MDPLLALIDHPPRDPDALRNPALTIQVMERVHAQAVSRPSVATWWSLVAVAVVVLAVVPVDVEIGSLIAAVNVEWIGELLVVISMALCALFTLRRSV